MATIEDNDKQINQNLDQINHSNDSNDLNQSSEETTKKDIDTIINHCFATVEQTFLEERKGGKRIYQRKCPFCHIKIGHFGSNFRRHVNACCPILYEHLNEVSKGEYFSSRQNMEKIGLFNKQWVSGNPTIISELVQKIKQQSLLSLNKTKKDKIENGSQNLQGQQQLNESQIDRSISRMENGKSSSLSFMKIPKQNHSKTEMIFAPPEALWYNNTRKYLEQQVFSTHGALTAEPDKAKNLMLKQIDIYPIRNDNLRTILQEKHMNEYEQNCQNYNYLFEEHNTFPKIKPISKEVWKSKLETLNQEIIEWTSKLEHISNKPDVSKYKKRKEGDFITEMNHPPKRSKLFEVSLVTI